MTAITNYNSLKTNIQDYHKRGDALSKYDTFIDSCEQEIADKLRVKEMEARATASTSTADRFLALPAGFVEMRQLQITIDSELYDLDFVPLKDMVVFSDAAVPTRFTITTQIEFNCKSDQAYTMEMDYWRSLTGLSTSNTTNDILTNYPDIYLFGCLKHAFLWSLQYDLAQFWENKFDKKIIEVNKRNKKVRFGPNPRKFMNQGMVV